MYKLLERSKTTANGFLQVDTNFGSFIVQEPHILVTTSEIQLPHGLVVPKGYAWDGFSAVSWLKWVGIDRESTACRLASCVHDYEYGQGIPQDIADAHLRDNLKKLHGMGPVQTMAVFMGVQMFGGLFTKNLSLGKEARARCNRQN